MKKIWQKASCRKTIKKIAFEDPKGTLAWAVLILFVIMGFLSSALRLALGHLGYDFDVTLINSLLTVLLMVAIAPLTLGLMNMFLKNSRDDIYTLSDLFGQIKKSPKYLLVFGLLMLGYTLIQWLIGLIPLVGPIINIVLFILFMPVYFIFPLVYLEHSNLNLKETIIKAFDIVSGRRIQFYAMLCSFAGWLLLGIITLGLLFIWVIPYLYIALTYLYLYSVAHEKEFDRPKSLGDGWLIIITILALGLFEVALIVNIPPKFRLYEKFNSG